MKTSLFILILLTFSQTLLGQNSLKVKVQNEDNGQPLAGANVYFDSLHIGASTDVNGWAEIKGIPSGRHILIVSYVGYRTREIPLDFPIKKRSLTVSLESAPFSSDQIVVTSTRNNSIVAQTPVRIEVFGKEEVNEEIAILPGNISKFLGESSSIITQRTSPISGAVSFRLQGLPARYTQMLKDGFPDFSGLASGFSPLQIPPLDLQQIEIIRGSYSPLFANGAIAGIVNLVSKKPTDKPHLDLLLNRTNRQGTDINAFYTAKYGPLGITFLSGQSLQNPVDVDHDGFSDFPRVKQTTVNPKIFYRFNRSTSLMVGVNSFFEDRTGGDMQALRYKFNTEHFLFEQFSSKRLGVNVLFKSQFNDSSQIRFKSSWQNFHQTATYITSLFSGNQDFNFNELSYFYPWRKHKLVGGLTFLRNKFRQQNEALSRLYDHNFSTVSLFFQDDWNVAPKWTLHGALRWDYRNKDNTFLLPHAAILFKPAANLNLRISGGLGYSIPNLSDVFPKDAFYTYNIFTGIKLHAEKSQDLSFDATYHLLLGDWALSLNQALYATYVKQVQFPTTNLGYKAPWYLYDASLTAKGAETHVVLNADDFEFFVDYNFADVNQNYLGTKKFLPFTPEHKLNFTATYEKEGRWRTGIEAFYTGRQYLPDGSKGHDYFIFGLMFEKRFNKFSLIFNVENVLDERQSKYGPIIGGTPHNPEVRDLYMPIEGRVANVVLWFKL